MIPPEVNDAYLRLIQPKEYDEVLGSLLLECTDIETLQPVHAICVLTRKGDGVEAVPVAVMTPPDIMKKLVPPADLKFIYKE